MQRRDAVRHIEGGVGEGQVLSVGLDAPEVSVECAAPEPDLLVHQDVCGDEVAVAGEPEARGPRLRRPDLEHAQPGRAVDVAVEENLERVPVRKPVRVVPAELAVHERKDGVDRVVGLVPALRTRLLEPALGFAELLSRRPAAPRAA